MLLVRIIEWFNLIINYNNLGILKKIPFFFGGMKYLP
jgi:hypothetical protein